MNSQLGRNDPCPCGSGKKYKKCCWEKAHQKRSLSSRVVHETGKAVGKIGGVFGMLSNIPFPSAEPKETPFKESKNDEVESKQQDVHHPENPPL